jgi:hypothetical protein
MQNQYTYKPRKFVLGRGSVVSLQGIVIGHVEDYALQKTGACYIVLVEGQIADSESKPLMISAARLEELRRQTESATTAAHIIACGPSATGLDISAMHGTTYAVNGSMSTYPDCDCGVCIDTDAFVTGFYHDAAKPYSDRNALLSERGFSKKTGLKAIEFVQWFSKNELTSTQLKLDWPNVFTNRNALVAAIHIAILQGHRPIYVYGADFDITRGNHNHEHGKQHTEQSITLAKKRYEQAIKLFEHYGILIKKVGQ